MIIKNRAKMVFLLSFILVISMLIYTVNSHVFTENKPFFFGYEKSSEQPSPFNRIDWEKIHVRDGKIILDVGNARFVTFDDTNSMDPVLDEGVIGIEIVPESAEEIFIGDVISYESESGEVIIHRVVDIGNDDDGWYCILKGDNNTVTDPEKVRFGQIKGLLVGILY